MDGRRKKRWSTSGFRQKSHRSKNKALQFDSKTQVAVYKDVYKYTMEKALYHEAEKKPFGCEFLISGNGEKRRVLVYVGDEVVNLDTVRYEQSDDKDLIYTVKFLLYIILLNRSL